MRPLALLLVTLVGLTAVPLATPSSSTGNAPQGKKMTLTVISRIRPPTLKTHDLKPKGKPNRGDWIHYQALLLAVKKVPGSNKYNAGDPIAWEEGRQTFLSATETRLKGTAHFPGKGTISFNGVMVEQKNGVVTVKVVGGTGKFYGATGVLLISSDEQNELDSVNIYRITLGEPGVA
jgi:hypothetical protein